MADFVVWTMKTLEEVFCEIKAAILPYYVYVLHRPDRTPFYIGKGTVQQKGRGGQRVEWHEYEAKLEKPPQTHPYWNKLKVNTIRKIWKQGKEILYSIDSWHAEEASAYAREMELIALYGRRIKGEGPLTNLTEGGEKEAGSVSDETKRQISESLKQYYRENPEKLTEMSERAVRYFEQNPEAIENARKNSIENGNAGYIARWLEHVDPEVLAEKGKQHSEFMKQWHTSEYGIETTKQAAAKRNEKVRTEEHRQHMARKTAEYRKNNPEVEQARLEKIRQTKSVKIQARQEKLFEIQEKLFCEGKIKKKSDYVTAKHLYAWKRRGLINGEADVQ